MTNYIRAANPIWYMVDHTGEPLNDEYYAFFLQNTFPYLPALVYRDPNGSTVWTGGIVQFEPSGTLPNNLYFADDQTYRIEIRHGNTQADELIWEIDDFVPGNGGPGPVDNLSLNTDNQISNPQFSLVSFNPTLEINAAGTYEVAPGWSLVLTGAGTATVTQLTNLKGTDDIITNPAYALEFELSGWTTAKLFQRFAQNGSIWAATSQQPDSAITLSAIAISNDGVERPLSIGYQPSNEAAPIPVASGTLSTTEYTFIGNAVLLDPSTNATANPDAYVDVVITLPPTGDVSISSVQAIGQNTDQPITLPFEQETVERQIDHLFHYYYESIIHQPKESILAGWQFATNPWQFTDPTQANLLDNGYTADQTVVVQQHYVDTGTNNNISVGRSSAANNYAFNVQAVTSENKFALINYVDPKTIRPYWKRNLSAIVRGYLYSPTNQTNVNFKMKVIYRTSLPPTVAQNEPISSWSLAGEPVFAAGWTELEFQNDKEFTLALGSSPSDAELYSFDKVTLPASSSDDMMIALVFYTTTHLYPLATKDEVRLELIDLVPNDFAIEANAETWDESLRKCQFYYCKTFKDGDIPQQNVGNFDGALSYRVITTGAVNGGQVWQFPAYMRATPTITGFNPSRASANWENQTLGAVSGPISAGNIGNSSAFITNATQVGGDTVNQLVSVHLTADARLGV